jgi:hypothetical protein
MIQILGHCDQMILLGQLVSLDSVSALYLNIREIEPDVGFGSYKPLFITYLSARIPKQCERSVHLLAKPLTTSALFPINLNKPMTFFRHVPILSHQYCPASDK